MKNQYVGDIGDYTKFGILRKLQKANFSIGINWYLTEDDGSKDGKYREYLKSECKTSDGELFTKLKEINDSGLLSVNTLEKKIIIQNAVYFKDKLQLPEEDYVNSFQYRAAWHAKALSALGKKKIVFLDPDNGLEVPSVNPFLHLSKGNKYATYLEAADYYKKGASVIIYQHKGLFQINEKKKNIERLNRLKQIGKTDPSNIFCYEADKRYYLFLAQPKDSKMIQGKIDEMIGKDGWKDYLQKFEF